MQPGEGNFFKAQNNQGNIDPTLTTNTCKKQAFKDHAQTPFDKPLNSPACVPAAHAQQKMNN